MQNSKSRYACLPSKIVEDGIDRFWVRCDWWRRLQSTSSVFPVWSSMPAVSVCVWFRLVSRIMCKLLIQNSGLGARSMTTTMSKTKKKVRISYGTYYLFLKSNSRKVPQGRKHLRRTSYRAKSVPSLYVEQSNRVRLWSKWYCPPYTKRVKKYSTLTAQHII